MSPQDNPPKQPVDAGLATGDAGQVADVAIAACPRCGTDVTQTGFIAVVETYQAYNRSGGKVVKSYKTHSELSMLRCTLCCAPLHVTLAELLGD